MNVLRATSEYFTWWFEFDETKEHNEREYVSRLSGMLGYDQDVLMVLFEIASLVNRKSGGWYVVRMDKWMSMFGEYELTNELSHNRIGRIFGGKPTFYLRVGRSKSPFMLKEQMQNQNLKPPRISKMELLRIMNDIVSTVFLNLKSRDVSTGGVFCKVGSEENDATERELEEEQDYFGADDGNDGERFDGSVTLMDKPVWVTRTNTTNHSLFLILSRFGLSISDVEISALLSELIKFHRYLGKEISFGKIMDGKDCSWKFLKIHQANIDVFKHTQVGVNGFINS